MMTDDFLAYQKQKLAEAGEVMGNNAAKMINHLEVIEKATLDIYNASAGAVQEEARMLMQKINIRQDELAAVTKLAGATTIKIGEDMDFLDRQQAAGMGAG
ncbi:MAG: hypothetical protein ACRC35_02225 [Angustibacter sp.]